MKDKRISVALAMVLASASIMGCGAKEDGQNTGASVEITESQDNFTVDLAVVEPEDVAQGAMLEESYDETFLAEEEIASSDIPEAYADLIKQYYDVLQMEDLSEANVPIGVMEVASSYTVEARLHTFGFALEDLNDDGIMEMIVSDGSSILAVYTTLQDAPALIVEGWARNQYHLLEDNRLLRLGSGGAAVTIMGVYEMTEDGLGLQVVDFYFTDSSNPESEEVVWYYNTTGESDIENSDKVFEEEENGAFDWYDELLLEEKELEYHSFEN